MATTITPSPLIRPSTDGGLETGTSKTPISATALEGSAGPVRGVVELVFVTELVPSLFQRSSLSKKPGLGWDTP